MAGGHGRGLSPSTLADFRRYLYSLGLSGRTVAVYVRLVVRAEAWCEPLGHDLDTVPPEALQEWADTLARSTSSRRQARSALGHYWRMTGRADAPTWVVRVPRQPIYVSRALEVDEAATLEAAARARGDHKGLAVLAGLYLAFRVSETAGMRWGDIGGGWIKVLGKGSQPAELPLHPVLATALDRLPRRCDTFVFPGRFGTSVHPATCWQWIRQVADEAGLGKVPSHRLRHTSITVANERTENTRAVQAFARHQRLSTTAIYARVSTMRLTMVVGSLDFAAQPDAGPSSGASGRARRTTAPRRSEGLRAGWSASGGIRTRR